MKKILALVLAFAMVFSSIPVVFADSVSEEAKALAMIGALKGDNDGVTVEYLAQTPTRLQAAIMLLRLKGLEEEAMAFESEDNFEDVLDYPWAEGKNMMAYLKANPAVGFRGTDKGFEPNREITAKEFYKVILVSLGYVESDAEVVGDFTWDTLEEKLAEVGLGKVLEAESFTNNEMAVATVEALGLKLKDSDVTLLAKLVEDGVVDEEAAVAAGLIEEAAAEVTVAVDSVKALGNTVVEVVFEEDVDEAALGNADNYAIEGLEIKNVVVTGSDSVRLETAAMTAGKIYTLTVGEEKVNFTGVAKKSDGPELTDAVSEDVEEVVLTFDMNLDYESATDVSNYSISGVEIVEAEVDEDEVTLTTKGLKNKQRYTVKVTNIKSIDGVTRRATSRSFSTRVDTVPPRINSDKTKVETNQRIILYFNEKVTKETAEDLANYTIKENKTDGAELEILSVTWDSDDKDNVEIITEPQSHNVKYKLTVNNISDRRKEANVMTRPSTWNFKGAREDKTAPNIKAPTVISNTAIMLEFSDDSRIDEDSALDLSNYTFSKGNEDLVIEDIVKVKSKNGLFKALLTVEGMEANKRHTLKVVDVLDEFGNAMREKTVSFTPKATEFASANLEEVEVKDKNTIVLKFDKDLVEETAENIANYNINKDIGAPTKAEYDDDEREVKLTVNELTQGVEYKITVDGVQDLVGNVLVFKDVKFDTKSFSKDKAWDKEAPKLYDAYAVNKYVVALEFDEEVDYKDNTKLVLKYKEDNGDEEDNGDKLLELELEAKSRVDDNTVIEFSKYDAEVELKEGVTYTVYKVVYDDDDKEGAIYDLAGNTFELEDGEVFEFDGTDEDPELAYVENYEQVNGVTFVLTMSKNVEKIEGKDNVEVNGITFKISVDKNEVTFEGNKPIKEGVEYEFNLCELLTDEHGFEVENEEYEDGKNDEGKTVLLGDYTDEDEPYIVDVIVVDRETIEVEFSEHIKSATGAFKLKNIDTDRNITITEVKVDEEIVTLTLGTPLEARYEYELTLIEGKALDFVEKKAAEDVFYFYGTDLAKVEINN